jgi:hypothetical protein
MLDSDDELDFGDGPPRAGIARIRGMKEKIVFEDYFANNALGWFTAESGELRARLEPEAYRLEFDAADSPNRAVYNAESFEFGKSTFRLHALVSEVVGNVDAGLGIAWNVFDTSNYCAFVVSPAGRFRVSRWSDGEQVYFTEWMTTGAIVSNGGPHWLELRRDGGDLYFLINSELVFVAPV